MLGAQTPAPFGGVRTDFAGSFKIVGDSPLGAGLTAKVWTAQVLITDRSASADSSGAGVDSQFGDQVAAKIYNDSASSAELLPSIIKREADLLAEVQGHPNVLRFHSLFLLGSEEVPTEEGSQGSAASPHWCLTTELCGAPDLYTTLSRRRLQEADARHVIFCILGALEHIHERGVLHRDVKVENIMIRADGTPVLADFGLSCRTSDEEALMKRCGSPGYIPPEVLLKEGWREESDVFAVGVMLYVLLCRKRPFAGGDLTETLVKTVQCRVNFSQHSCFESVTPQCKAFIRLLTSKSPEDRPLAEEALQESWIQEQAMALPNCLADSSDGNPSFTLSQESAPQIFTDRVPSPAESPLLSLVPCHTGAQSMEDVDDEQSDRRSQEDEVLAGSSSEAGSSGSGQSPSSSASWKYFKKLSLRRATGVRKPNVMGKFCPTLKTFFRNGQKASSVTPVGVVPSQPSQPASSSRSAAKPSSWLTVASTASGCGASSSSSGGGASSSMAPAPSAGTTVVSTASGGGFSPYMSGTSGSMSRSTTCGSFNMMDHSSTLR